MSFICHFPSSLKAFKGTDEEGLLERISTVPAPVGASVRNVDVFALFDVGPGDGVEMYGTLVGGRSDDAAK